MIHRSLTRALASAILIAFMFPGAIAADAVEPTAEDLALRAEKLLDQSPNDESALVQAEQAIAASLEKRPLYSHALVEKARLTMIRGKESPESLQAAERMLQGARNNDFNYGRAYIFQGYVYTKLGRQGEAHQAFFSAKRLAPDDPLFALYYASYLESTGDIAAARQYREKYVASGATDRKALFNTHHALLDASLKAGDRTKAEAEEVELTRLEPRNAWVPGDYGRLVILYFQDFDAGERHAKDALAIMDYPHARETLSLALYGKWAAAKRAGKDPKVVLALLNDAKANDPGARNVPGCALAWPPLKFLDQSLQALGAPVDKSRRDC